MIGKQKRTFQVIVKINSIRWRLKKDIKERGFMTRCNFVQDGKPIKELNKIGTQEFQVRVPG